MKKIIFLVVLTLSQAILPGWNSNTANVIQKQQDNLLLQSFLLYSQSATLPTAQEDPDDPKNKIMQVPNCSSTYYVDFVNGNDSNTGKTTATAWKHCPGDTNASGVPAAITLKPGDVISFRGGVIYRGSIRMKNSGSTGRPIFFEGSCWNAEAGKAIIDGSDVLTGWKKCSSSKECGANPNWTHIYHTRISADDFDTPFSSKLHENNEYLWLSQHPNLPDPYFWDDNDNFISVPSGKLTSSSVTDSVNLTQRDPASWRNSSAVLWISGDLVVVRNITNFDPASHRITFADAGRPYPNRPGRYSIINSMLALDQSGEYYINPVPESDGSHIVYLWPRNIAHLADGITISTRRNGIDIANSSYITIEGFQIQNFSGGASSDGIAIGTVTAAHLSKTHITIRGNDIRHNSHGTSHGKGCIYLNKCDTSLVENNVLFENMKLRGILVTNSNNAIVRNNTLTRPGGTGICFFTNKKSQIVGNTVSGTMGSHANGITTYMACYDILIAWNKITKSRSPITYNNSGNLFFYRNLIDANGLDQCVNEWGFAKSDPAAPGTIFFINNTIVRTDRHQALRIGAWDKNKNIIINNIIDGANGKTVAPIDRSYNIYTGLNWSQTSRYGWSLGKNEILEKDLKIIFNNAANGDFHLRPGSPAINAGLDITGHLPVRVFPHVNFWKDLEGNAIPKNQFNLGAYK